MTSRRQFIGASALLLGSSALAEEAVPSIIDAHFHIWDRGRLQIPWLRNSGPLLNRNYSAGDYAAAIAEMNVRGSIYVEVNVEPVMQSTEADMAIALCNKKIPPVRGAVVGGDPTDPHFAGYVDQLQTKAAIRGMRVTLSSKPAADPRVVNGLRRLGKLKLTVDLNAEGVQLLGMIDLVRACEETSFVIDHCGNVRPSWFDSQSPLSGVVQWRETMKQLAACPNVACKISGVAENGAPAKAESVRSVAKECLDLFGPDRVLFATNWPVCLKATTPAKWLAVVDELTRHAPAEDRAKLFSENATHWYRLDQ